MKMDNDFAKLQRETRKRNRKQAMGIFFGRGIIVKLCTVVVVGFIFMAVFADWITPYDPAAQNLVEKLHSGDKIKVAILRSGKDEYKEIEFSVTIGAR